MMRAPPATRIQSRYSKRNWPAALNDAPRLTNTVVNPAMNAIECNRTMLRAPDASAVSRSTDIPVMKDRYDGKSGRTHGDRNENKPAENATRIPSDSPMSRLYSRRDAKNARAGGPSHSRGPLAKYARLPRLSMMKVD